MRYQGEILTSEERSKLVKRVTGTVEDTMSKPPFDPSHDFHHIHRVLALTETLAAAEKNSIPKTELSMLLITLTALLHDIGDRKYALTPTHINGVEKPELTPESILLLHSAPHELAATVQLLVDNVSCSNEEKYPDHVAQLIIEYPELAIVQDADRLDAVGAVGIARVFVFNCHRGDPLTRARKVFDQRLLPREEMMKTALGKSMSKERCAFLRTFMAQFDSEVGEHAPERQDDGSNKGSWFNKGSEAFPAVRLYTRIREQRNS